MPSTSTVETNTGRIINVDQVHPGLGLVYDPTLGTWHPMMGVEGRLSNTNYVWDTGSLSWVVMTQPSGGGGGGGGAITIADGADVNAGTTTDAAITTDAPGTLSAKLRGLVAIFSNVWDFGNSRLNVGVGNFPATQVISDGGASLTVDGTVAISNLPTAGVNGQDMFVYKIGTASEAAGSFYCWAKDSGSPGAWAVGTPGLNGRVTDGTTAADNGCLRVKNPASGSNYLSQIALATNVACFLNIADVVWVNSGLVVTTTTAQAITTPAFPARDDNGSANGEGYTIALLVTTATTNAGAITTMTVSYTNQDGTAGKTATLASFPATAVIGTLVIFQLAAGDTGVRSIQSITLATSLVTGAVSLLVMKVVGSQSSATANAGGPVTQSVMDPGTRLYNGVCLLPFGLMSATTATTLVGTLVAVER